MKALLQKASLLALFFALRGACLMAAPPGGVIRLPAKWAGTAQTAAPVAFWTENFSLPNGTTADSGATAWTSSVTYAPATFSVYNNEFEVNNISVNGLGTWTSAPINIAGKTNILLSAAVRSAGSLENDGTPHADYIRFYYKVDGGAEVLFSNLNGIINNNSTADSTVYSTGVISGSTVQIIIRAKATATDEFYYFDDVTVAGNNACTADASASASGALSCTADSVVLLGSSATAGAAYSWSGPNNFTAVLQNPLVRAAGAYTLVVTSPGGCTATAGVVVTQNTTVPAGVSAFVDQQLTCSVTNVNLSGASSTAGVVYNWTGPKGFTAAAAHAQTGIAGLYTLTVTDPVNGCSKAAQLIVVGNTTPPAGVSASNSGPLTCDISQVTLTGTSSSPNVEYEWDGPDGYLSFSAQDFASEAGDYVLTVTNDDNGCTATQTTTVAFDCSAARRAAKPLTTAADSSNGNVPEYKVWPNPCSGNAFIGFQSPKSAFVTVQVYNNSGITEKILFNSTIIPGQPYQFALTGLPAGIHYVLVRVNDKVYTQKLVSIQ